MKTVGIVTKYNNNCIFCGRPTTEEHHLLFGNGFRKLAEEDGIKVPVCEYCHTRARSHSVSMIIQQRKS